MKRLILLIAAVMSAMSAFAAVAPVQRYSSNVQRPMEGRDLVFMQNSSQLLYWTFYEPPATNLYVNVYKDISAATSVKFTFAPADRSWRQTVTGALDTGGTNGGIIITFNPTNLNPNSLNGNFDYTISVSNSSATLAYVSGSLTIEENIESTGGDLYTIDNIIINWHNYGGYTNTSVYGPYRAGQSITFTTNSDGSCSINGKVDQPQTNAIIGTTQYYVGAGFTNSITATATNWIFIYNYGATTNYLP